MRNDNTAAIQQQHEQLQKIAQQESKQLQKRASNWLKTHAVIQAHLPLAIGILEQLFEARPDWVSKSKIRMALARHCRSRRYRDNQVEPRPRFDLDGKENGAVTAEQAGRAKGLLQYSPNPNCASCHWPNRAVRMH